MILFTEAGVLMYTITRLCRYKLGVCGSDTVTYFELTPSVTCYSIELPLRVGLICNALTHQILCVHEAHMCSTNSRTSVLQCVKVSDVFGMHDERTLNFYLAHSRCEHLTLML